MIRTPLILMLALAACTSSTQDNAEAEQIEIQRLDSIDQTIEQSEGDLNTIQAELDEMEQILDSLNAN